QVVGGAFGTSLRYPRRPAVLGRTGAGPPPDPGTGARGGSQGTRLDHRRSHEQSVVSAPGALGALHQAAAAAATSVALAARRYAPGALPTARLKALEKAASES